MKVFNSKWFLLLVPAFLGVTVLAILIDIPVLRQFMAFLLLSFIPGLLLLRILKLDRLNLVEVIILSTGLSIAFTMLFGFVLNTLLLAYGYTEPLALTPLLIWFGTANLILAAIAYFTNKEITFCLPAGLTLREKQLLIVPAAFPLLSIAGVHLMNLTDNNMLLMLSLFLIPGYVIFIAFYSNSVPQRLYPGLIYLISISLLLMLSLRSNHIIGSDIHYEYYLFQTTLSNRYWLPVGQDLLDACLSISLMPAIYQSLLAMAPEYLFKLIYTLLFSVTPLATYVIARKYIGNRYAFLASFFFMAQVSFLWAATGPRTSIAILFFTLGIMVLFHDNIHGLVKKLLLIFFLASCVVSHYTTTYIFFFILLLTWIGTKIASRIQRRQGVPAHFLQASHSTDITLTTVLLLFLMFYFWYSQILVGTFNVSLGFLRTTFLNLHQLFVMEARGPTITAAFGEGIYSIPQDIRVVFSWLAIALIAAGVFFIVAKYRSLVTAPASEPIEPDFLYSKIEPSFLVLSLACSATLVIAAVLPWVSVGYSMERAFFQTLAVLSIFFIIGGIMIARWLRLKPHWIITLLVLIPFFMCTSGTMYQLFDIPSSIVLNSTGIEYEHWYINDGDSYAAKWIAEYGENGAPILIGSDIDRLVLVSQGKISPYRIKYDAFSHNQESGVISGYIYLRHSNIIGSQIATESPDEFSSRNKIYFSNSAEIYH